MGRISFVAIILAFYFGLVVAVFSEIKLYLPFLLKGALVTIELTILSILLALFCSFIAGFGRISRSWIIRWVATIYIEVFRGTSLLVIIFWVYFVLPEFGISIGAFWAAVLAIGLNFGAYCAEVVRASILSVPKGQLEAAIALNMSRWTMMQYIIVPQALVTMILPLGNLFIMLLKATALASSIALSDLTFATVSLNYIHFKTLQIFGLSLFMYYLFSQIIRMLIGILDQRIKQNLKLGRI